jgi:hypothetical protein
MKDSADIPPPRSMASEEPYHPPTPKSDRKGLDPMSLSAVGSPKVLSPSPKKGRSAQQLEELANADVRSRNGIPMTNGYGVQEDLDDGGSNIQEGRQSDLGQLLPVVRLVRPSQPLLNKPTIARTRS